MQVYFKYLYATYLGRVIQLKKTIALISYQMNQLLYKCLLTPLLFCFSLMAVAQLKGIDKNIALSKDRGTLQKIIKIFKGKPTPLINSTNITISKQMK